ncbi:pentapeptide repeat protein [Bifidobacterium angulatum]|uniref:pentapeptide repeat-containing protein n=1 Tax=Bifidobacterium angulatum TaxID=1683 RepID=UPI000504D9A5|nr:pentapeptide repeat-containing protein [Bifidobacterium angulatum]KFI40836.1 pentapeptide repeat protein [Bifidobacterium angulatum]
MAEEPEEPSDGMTQPSREKPPWVRPLWLLSGFLLVVVGSLPWLSTVLPQWGTMLRQWGTILWQWCLGSWQWVLFLLLRLSGFLLLLKVVWPWLSTVLPQWGKKLSQKRKAAGRWCKEWMGRLPLFAAIAIWAVLGIIAFLLAMWWLGRVPFWQLKLDPMKQAENIVKIALTLVGGVGAVAYLVIKYQERQQAGRAEKREKDRIVETKVQDAINQLGSDKASTRIAGVYALTDIADRYKGGYRQRVVDILCGYLRSDRETYPLGEDGKPATGLPRSGDADKAVESTILSMFVAHLKKGPRDENGDVTLRQQVRNDQLWCDCSFDLHGATFHEDVRLIGTTFEHGLNFQGTKFERGANFSGAHFTGGASFSGAHFTGGADFGGADLDGANFSGAHFTGGANFVMAEFRTSAVFSGIQGQPSFRFEECKFNKIFRGAYEWGPIPIPEDNDGLPAGAVWKDFLEEALKDKDFLELWRNLNKCLKEYGKDGGTTNR